MLVRRRRTPSIQKVECITQQFHNNTVSQTTRELKGLQEQGFTRMLMSLQVN